MADFIKLRPNERVVDLGTGSGIVALLLTAKSRNISVTALDIQPEMTNLLERSVAINQLTNIKIMTEDLRNAPNNIGKGLFSLVVANPPYFPVKAGEHSPDQARAIARTELMCSLEDLIKTSALLLNYGGGFVFIHRPSRLPEIFSLLKHYSLEPKRMRLVFPYRDKEPNLVLVEARKNAGPELRISPPLYIYSEPGKYSEEIQRYFKKVQ